MVMNAQAIEAMCVDLAARIYAENNNQIMIDLCCGTTEKKPRAKMQISALGVVAHFAVLSGSIETLS